MKPIENWYVRYELSLLSNEEYYIIINKYGIIWNIDIYNTMKEIGKVKYWITENQKHTKNAVLQLVSSK